MADVRVDVERATPGDVQGVAALVDETIGAATVYSERARREERAKYHAAGLAAMLGQDPDSVLLARVRGRLAGFALSRYDDGLLWPSWLGVAPELRRGGVARALLAGVEHTAPGRGCHALWCDCRTDTRPPSPC